MIRYLIFLFITIFFINSCSFSNNLDNSFIRKKILNFFEKKQNIVLLNFDNVIEKIIIDLSKYREKFISNKTSFFINLLKNKSNIIINQKKLTNVIKNKISQNMKNVYFFEKEIINNKNKKKIELSNTNNSIDTSTAILLSRNNNIKYYLYSCLFEDKKTYLLKVQLILVKTGEIVFSRTEKFY